MALLDLSADDVLTTTRAVRKRLDFERPVPDELVRECVATAMQAPSGSNVLTMQFVVVRDPATRAAIGEVYGRCFAQYRQSPYYAGAIDQGSDTGNAQQRRVVDSAEHLAEHMGEAPVLVIPCTAGTLDRVAGPTAAAVYGNILPAAWSFMLAARARGLGTCWTTLHLFEEQAVAELIGIPYQTVRQACLTPLAFTRGTDFRPADRPPADTVIHWDTW
jgi:nitroreductase